MGEERLVKQAFLESAAVAQTLTFISIVRPWADQAASFLA